MAGKRIIRPPTHCPNGHQLGPNQVLVGHVACLGHGGGHTSSHCRTCDAVVYGPLIVVIASVALSLRVTQRGGRNR